MFKLIEKNKVNRSILNCDYIRYSSAEISTINTANSQKSIKIPREASVISLSNSSLIQTLMYYMPLVMTEM